MRPSVELTEAVKHLQGNLDFAVVVEHVATYLDDLTDKSIKTQDKLERAQGMTLATELILTRMKPKS